MLFLELFGVPLQLLLLGLAAAGGKEPRMLHGSVHSLPASAPENKALLDLEYTPIQDTMATVGEAFEQNNELYSVLSKVVQMPYFSTYKVDLSDARCPFDDDTATCGNRQCAIEPLSSKDIDDSLFESQYLGRLRKNSVSKEAPHDAGNAEDCAPASASLYAASRNHDYCYPEDESQDSAGVWVDLRGNTERFTGYSGDHARLMWALVYAENCFGYAAEQPPAMPEKNKAAKLASNEALGSLGSVLAHPHVHNNKDNDNDSDSVSAAALSARKLQDLNIPEGCVEQRLFYRLLSGMHASISTHLTYDWLNTTSDEWTSNLGDWLERVGWHEDRLNNLFFDYVLMSRAVAKLVGQYERQLLFSSSCHAVDTEVRVALRRLGRLLRLSPLRSAIDERQLFASPDGLALKNEFRARVRNVNALMSCVGCERCRLWGKIQTAGYGTALKILFELPATSTENEEAAAEVLSSFRRSELVALINTFARISHSVHAISAQFLPQAEAELLDQDSFAYQWRIAWRETVRGLKYIFWSYVNFPRNLYRIAMYQAAIYWKRFTGEDQPLTPLEDLNSGFHTEL